MFRTKITKYDLLSNVEISCSPSNITIIIDGTTFKTSEYYGDILINESEDGYDLSINFKSISIKILSDNKDELQNIQTWLLDNYMSYVDCAIINKTLTEEFKDDNIKITKEIIYEYFKKCINK